MNTTTIATVAAAAGLVVGFVGARALAPTPAVAACPPAAAQTMEAKTDAIARQLHAHDRDPYVPHPAPPVGERSASAKDESTGKTH